MIVKFQLRPLCDLRSEESKQSYARIQDRLVSLRHWAAKAHKFPHRRNQSIIPFLSKL